ncbi:MAG: histidine phosphatase family protein [Tetrasphaera sp.]
MSLHCPAVLYVARHGDAVYDQGHGILSDAGGTLSETGRAQVATLAAALAEKRIGAVHTSVMTRAAESGALAAAALGVPHRQLAGLEEWRVGDLAGRSINDPAVQEIFGAWLNGNLHARIPGAESGAEIVARYREALEAIADQHRGENVLIFSHGGVMSLVLPLIAINLTNDHARGRYLPNAVPAIVEAGDDGWFVREWPGKQDKSVV